MNYFSISRFLLFLVPFVVLIVLPELHYPFVSGKFILFRGIVGLAFISFLLGIVFNKQEADKYWQQIINVIKSPLGVVIGIFTFLFLLSGFLGVDPMKSFWSNFERGEGGLQILFLYIFFLLISTFFTKQEDWTKYIKIFLLSGLLSILYGIGGGLGIFQSGYFANWSSRFTGSLGNASWFASYMIFAIFFALYLLIDKKVKKTKKDKYWLVTLGVVFFIFFFWSATRGAILGLIIALVVGFLYITLLSKKWRKYASAFLLVILLSFSGLWFYQDSSLIKNSPVYRVFETSIEERNVQERLMVWNISLEAFKERPVLGWGPENFNQVFYEYYDTNHYKPSTSGAWDQRIWFDKAHNSILGYLVETGVLGFLSYLSIFMCFALLFVRSKIREEKSIFVASVFLMIPIAYLVQNLFIFETLTAYISFYIFLGLSAFVLNKQNYA